VQVAARRPRAALCAARLVEPLLERSPGSVLWREGPPELAASPAKPAASEVVAHATLGGCWRPVLAPSVGLETASQSTRNLRDNSMDFSTPFLNWPRLVDRNG